MGRWWCHTVALICIFLITNDAEHAHRLTSHWYINLSEMPIFIIGLILLFGCKCCLYIIVDVVIYSWLKCFVSYIYCIFFPVWSLYIHVFKQYEQNVLIWITYFWLKVSVSYSGTLLSTPMSAQGHEANLRWKASFKMQDFTFRSLICLKLVFLC